MRSRASTVADSEANKRVNVLGVAWAVNTLAHSMVFPFLPLYLIGERHLPLSKAGLVFPVMGLATLAGTPIGGLLADKWGRRQTLVIGTMGRSIAFFTLAIMAWRDAPFWAIAAALGCASFIGSFFQNASDAYVTDLIVPDDHVLAFGRVRVGLNVGFMIGPAIGSFLARTPFSLMFAITGMLCAIVSAWCATTCPPIPAERGTSPAPQPAGCTRSGLRGLLPIVFLTLILGLSVSQFIATLTVYSTSVISIPKEWLGFLFSINGGMVILFLMPLTRALRGFRPQTLIAAGALLYVVAYLGFGTSHCWRALAWWMVVLTIGEMISKPSISAVVSMRAPAGMAGRWMSLQGLAQSSAWSFGPYLGALAVERWSYSPLMLWSILASGAAVAAVGFMAMAVWGRGGDLRLET